MFVRKDGGCAAPELCVTLRREFRRPATRSLKLLIYKEPAVTRPFARSPLIRIGFLAAVLAGPTATLAHGVVGERFFPATIATDAGLGWEVGGAGNKSVGYLDDIFPRCVGRPIFEGRR